MTRSAKRTRPNSRTSPTWAWTPTSPRSIKLDDKTVKFTLKDVDAAFIQNMAMSFASIQSAEYAAQLLKEGKAADINQKPVGTGPFVFKSYQKTPRSVTPATRTTGSRMT